jgi:peptide/nickel transport system permease protein
MTSTSLTQQLRQRWREARATRKFFSNFLTLVGLCLVVLFVAVAVAAPFISPPRGECLRDLGGDMAALNNPLRGEFWQLLATPPATCYLMPRVTFDKTPSVPGELAPLGTLEGYDILYGLAWGTRTTFFLGFTTVLITLVIGIVIGVIAGYFGGWVDNFIMRSIDIIFSFPSIILTIVLLTMLGPGLGNIVLAFTLTGWAGYARVIRGEVLRIRGLEYVESAKALGASSNRVMARHVLPNVLGSTLVLAVLDMGTVPLLASGLSFLGLGTPVGYADWGQLINLAQGFIQGPPGEPFKYWFVSFFPGITILLFSLGWNLLGDALQDALDARRT